MKIIMFISFLMGSIIDTVWANMDYCEIIDTNRCQWKYNSYSICSIVRESAIHKNGTWNINERNVYRVIIDNNSSDSITPERLPYLANGKNHVYEICLLNGSVYRFTPFLNLTKFEVYIYADTATELTKYHSRFEIHVHRKTKNKNFTIHLNCNRRIRIDLLNYLKLSQHAHQLHFIDCITYNIDENCQLCEVLHDSMNITLPKQGLDTNCERYSNNFLYKKPCNFTCAREYRKDNIFFDVFNQIKNNHFYWILIVFVLVTLLLPCMGYISRFHAGMESTVEDDLSIDSDSG